MKTATPTQFKETVIGLIPEEWKIAQISDIADKVAIGPFGSSIKIETFVTEGVPVISGQHLRGMRLEDSDYNFITKAHAEKLRNSIVFRGDVIFTHAGNIGQVAYIPNTSKYDHYIISQRQFYLRCNKEKAIPEFITYFFKAPTGQHALLSNKSQTGVPSIAQPVSHLRKIEIVLPPISEQKLIAEILSSLDDKIELNSAISTNLEKVASSLFKKWFVDIGNELPEGWRVCELREVLELNYGKALKADGRKEGSIKVYGSSGFVGLHDEKLVDGPGIIVGRKGNVGSVFWSNEAFFPIDTTYFVTSKYPLIYCYYLLKNQTFVNGDSVVPGLNRDQAYRTEIVLPNKDSLEKFDAVASDLRKSITSIENENEMLFSIRDSLLPRLMSGTVRVNT